MPSASLVPRLQPVRRGTLHDSAYASLRAALMEGRLAPGQRLVLRELADQLGISLTPVRDAVNRLVAERVLDRGSVGQGGGATVPLLDADQFGQLMAVRAGLEPVATEAALRHATPAKLDAIEDALIGMKRAAHEAPERYLAEHHRFHFGIYGLCCMPIVMDVIEGAWMRCAPTLTLTLPKAGPDLKRYPLHVAALAALRKGDGPAAATAIRADIESARDDVCAILAQRAGTPRSSPKPALAKVSPR